MGCVGYVGEIFLTLVIIFTWVAWVNFFYMGQNFRRDLKIFQRSKFLRGSTFVGLVGAFTVIS